MCYFWDPALVFVHVLGDLQYALAYLMVAIVFTWVGRRAERLSVAWGSITAFSSFCAVTHTLSAVAVFSPVFWTFGVVKAAGGIVSLSAAFLLFKNRARIVSASNSHFV